MDQSSALQYLRQSCHFADASDAALIGHWNTAREKLGDSVSEPGRCDLDELPAHLRGHARHIESLPRFAEAHGGGALRYRFGVAEIAPLLAYQFHVDDDRVPPATSGLSLDDLMPICLPPTFEEIKVDIVGIGNGIQLRSRNLNLRMLQAGLLGMDMFGRQIAGAAIGSSAPWVQVVRFDGRCYLRNGYHRASQLLRAGINHMPCLFLEATDWSQVGALGAGATFDRTLLESENPPTCRHLHPDRAYAVDLKRVNRYLQVTWSEFAAPEPD
jgi:hypothetical protein